MSTDNIEPNNDKAEQKASKDELSEKELEKASGGGENVSLSFGNVKVVYKPQKEDGSN